MPFAPHRSAFVLALIAALSQMAGPAEAQQTPNDIWTDGTTGTDGVVHFRDVTSIIRADRHGTKMGPNLFFGFDRFNVGNDAFVGIVPGDTPVTAQNVIALISGSDPSDILGNLNIDPSIGEDHFFFVNPNGVIFGPKATVSTNGSLHVSSADEIVFDNGEVISARNLANSVLSSALPEAFGFLGNNAGKITILGEEPGETKVRPDIEVGRDKIITIVGGDIELNRALVFAPGGTIRLVSTKSPGRVAGIRHADAELDVSDFDRLGQIELLDRTTVSASGFEPDSLGEDPEPFDLRTISRNCGSECLIAVLAVPIDEIDETGLGDVVIERDEAAGLAVVLRPIGKPGGDILVRGDSLRIEDSDLRSRSFGVRAGGGAGDIDIRLGGDLELEKLDDTEEFETAISARAETVVFEYENPRPGLVPLVTIPGGWPNGFVTPPASGEFALGANSEGGNITIEAENATLSNGARITASTFSNGVAGDIELRLGGRLTLTGTDASSGDDATPTALFSNAQGDPEGNGGKITVRGRDGADRAPEIRLENGGAIIAQTTADADAGDIDVHASTIFIGFDSQIDSATSGQTKDGGDGAAGELTIRADEEIVLEGGLRPSFFAHISTGSKPESVGPAGQITIRTPRLVARDGPAVSVVSQGSGAGGNLVLDVGELILDNATISAESEGAAGSNPGDAGQIEIGPEGAEYPNTLVRLRNGSQISTRAVAAGGGNILINAQLMPVIKGGEEVLELVKPGDGLSRRIELRDSEISTSVTSGADSGGNIAIDPSALVLIASAITAQADAGAGGDIFIATDFIIQSADSVIDASAGPAGIDGEIVVQGTSVLVVDQSAEQPAAYLRADALLTERCAARVPGEGVGRLTVESLGDGGAPLDGYLFSWPGSVSSPASLSQDQEACGSAS